MCTGFFSEHGVYWHSSDYTL